MQSNFVYRDWARTIECRPRTYHQPSSVEEVVEIVQSAEAAGDIVRVFGATHSWSSFVLTGGVLLNLDRMCNVIAVDPANRLVTVQAGIRIKDLVRTLEKAGLALPNLGSIMEQSVAGAISNGTHGTGHSLGALHTQVVGMKIVSGGGGVLEISEAEPELLSATQVSLGALGIVVEVTLRCVPFYNVHQKAWAMPFAESLDEVGQLLVDNQRVRFYWLPGTDQMYVNTLNNTNDLSTKSNSLVTWGRERFLRYGVLAVLMRLGEVFPSWIEAISRFESKVGFSKIDEVGPYYQQLLIGVSPRHLETEYSIPIDRTVEGIIETRRIMEANGNRATLPQEFRFVRGDTAMLSPAHGRDSCYVCAQTSSMKLAKPYFRDFEVAMKALGGRPHWGKLFTLSVKELEEMYPNYHQFCLLRRKLDPKGTFASKLVHELFS